MDEHSENFNRQKILKSQRAEEYNNTILKGINSRLNDAEEGSVNLKKGQWNSK